MECFFLKNYYESFISFDGYFSGFDGPMSIWMIQECMFSLSLSLILIAVHNR